MEKLNFEPLTLDILKHAPSLAVYQFTTSTLIYNTLGGQRIFIVAIRISDEAKCLNHQRMEIFFTTGFANLKDNPTRYWGHSFDFLEGHVCNFSELTEYAELKLTEYAELNTCYEYFAKFSEDKIIKNK